MRLLFYLEWCRELYQTFCQPSPLQSPLDSTVHLLLSEPYVLSILISTRYARTINQSLTYTCSDSNTHLTNTATHPQQILLSSIFIHGIFDCAGHGVRGLSYTPGYSSYFFYACAALVAAFILFWSILISKYTKVRYLSHCTQFFTSHTSSLTDAFTMNTLLLFLSFILPVCLPISYLVLFFAMTFVFCARVDYLFFEFLDTIFSCTFYICFQYNIWCPMHFTYLIFYILMCYSSIL